MNRGWYFILALLVVVVASFWALRMSRTSLSDRVARTGSIRLGYSVEEPFAFLDAQGRVTGAWPEVARRVLERMGIKKTEWVRVEFGSLLNDLNLGRFDAVVLGMTITPERQKSVDFSLPLAAIRPGLLVLKTNANAPTCYADAREREDVKIAALHGAVENEMLLGLGVSREQLMPVPDAQSGLSAVLGGAASGLALTLPTVRHMASADDRLEAREGMRPGDDPSGRYLHYCGYAFRKDDAAFLALFNRELRAFMATPEYAALIETYGFDPALLPQ